MREVRNTKDESVHRVRGRRSCAVLVWRAWLFTFAGPEVAPGEAATERASLGEAILPERLRAALGTLNPTVAAGSLDEVFRKLTLIESPSLIINNRSLHRLLVDGIAVECRREDCSVGAEIVRVIDFDDPDANDWVAVNQFTVIEGQRNRRPDVVIFVNGPAGRC